ncbi:MAG: 23S rRNA (uracil(1939)-C(5))-methyltransferase RlmD [Lachnospiraceae bacterium]|nr:23S rRNA (uracil(1939)-C(5))-methyltransferase RlmD [Lachnospiraceae bacterium]
MQTLEPITGSCPHFGSCGGCQFLDGPYESSLQTKEAQVRTLVQPALDLQSEEALWEETLRSPSVYGYRNKMEYTFGDAHKDGPLALGLHKKGAFHDIVTVSGCVIADEDFRTVVLRTLSFFTPLYDAGKISFYHRKNKTGYLRHLLVRKAVHTGEILIALVTSTQFEETVSGMREEEMLGAFGEALLTASYTGKIAGILHTRNDAVADVIRDEGTKVLFGKEAFTEMILGLSFRVSPFSFFQTNTRGAELIYETVRRYVRCALGGNRDADGAAGKEQDVRIGTVYDLYSGTGTITQLMSAVCNHAIGVEIVAEAVAAAKESANANGIENCTFLCGDVLKVLDAVADAPDLIILDPPRDGVHPKALKKILAYGVPYIVYVSCNPGALAKDLPVMRASGYEVRRLRCVDQFPWTRHVETVCLLYHQKDKFISVPYEPKDAEYLKSFPGTATYDEIKEYVLKKYNVKVSSLYVAQVKAKHGLEMRDCYNRPRSENSRQPQVPKEKEKMIEDALRHFRVIEN